MTHRSIEPPIELPPEDAGALFDLPDEPVGPAFELPDEAPPPVVLEAEPTGGVLELVITPEVDAYLALLERAVQPFVREGQQFCQQMMTAPIHTPEKLAWLGEQSLTAKAKEHAIEAVFEPAIRTPKTYLDRVYALRRGVMDGFKRGGEIAAVRYAERQRELQEQDRRARLEADRQTRLAQQEADQRAAEERRRLAVEATTAAQSGEDAKVADLLEQMRAVEPAPVAVVEPPPSLADAGKVAGLSSRSEWQGAIVDLKEALLASARPDIMREIADAIADGVYTVGAPSVTTALIATKLRALALEQPIIPSSLFQGDPAALSARAKADQDTLAWPGFRFTQKTIPVRRPSRTPKVTR